MKPTSLVALVVVLLAAAASVGGARLYAGNEKEVKAREDKEVLATIPAAPKLPVVLWHGMGDSCCASYSVGAIKAVLEENLGLFVYSIATGETAMADIWSSYFGNVNDQVAKVCSELRAVPQLKGGYNAVGFSQGGQFMRAVIQRCQHLGPKAHTLITLGAQHQGVSNVPGCSTVPTNLSSTPPLRELGRTTCEMMQTLLGRGAYLPWVNDHVVQAQYFKDPARMTQYLAMNPFLPDVNNEKEEKNLQYANNLKALEKMVLYRFAEDTTVVPRDSSWFSTFVGSELVALEDLPMYKEDWIGLRALDESGRLIIKEAPGAHMQFTLDWFEEEIGWQFLAGGQQPAARN